MGKINFRRIDAIRQTQGQIGNHVIDEFVSGRLSRRDFIRRGTIVGLSFPAIGALIAACGGSETSTTAETTGAAPVAGGTLIIASGTPSAASANLDPIAINDGNGIVFLAQYGQWLTVSQSDLTLAGSLATEWVPNDDASEWTFKLNPAAKYSDGSPVVAADVVATIERLVNPDNASNSLSAFQTGKLSPGGTIAVDDNTVMFKLDAPMGNFPYIVSSDNYNAIILPASVTDTTKFATSNIPTSGPFMIESYDAVKGATMVRNPNYWGTAPLLDKVEVQFIDDLGAKVTAFQSGDIDVVAQFPVIGGESLINNPDVNLIEIPSTAHYQIHMRTSKGAFADKRARQAMSMAIDHQSMVDGLLQGKAQVANDTPFFTMFPSSGSGPAREFNLEKAKALMAEAAPDGFDVTLYSWQTQEIPDLAVLVQNAGKELGINVKIELRDDYYNSYWVSWDANTPGSDLGITDYGHRGVPDVFLNAPLLSVDKGGVWNAAEFANADYDAAVATYTSSVDLQSQQAAALKIQEILQDESPLMIPYNFNFMSAAQKNISGVTNSGMGQVYAEKASKS